jgi:D-glycero-D-manno-heptose 1,7-bisphosphate phosphatase
MKQRALFLDRDGVINLDHGYVHRPEDFEFMPGIFDLVRTANNLNYRVVVVTNQAGIGRGYYSEAQFRTLMDWMCNCFLMQEGRIDAIYFCPYHPDYGLGPYKRESEFRKPAPGMLLQAARELDLDLSQSILVGDNISDIDAAISAGIPIRFLLGSTERSKTARTVSDLETIEHFLRGSS